MTEEKNRAPYLSHIKITGFGAFSDKTVGPFSPHLNVVFGANESGKTTLASFVGGVLFGWEEARGNRNTYKPQNARRAGSLFFSGDGLRDLELSRVRNADGVQGDVSLLSDIDKETFKTMFSLDGDELRSLRNTTDVTAKLLTAGSGTSASPAHALARVQERLAEYLSRAAGVQHSMPNLAVKQEELKQRIADASDEAERFKRQDRELRDLEPQREELGGRLAALNERIDGLGVLRANLQRLEEERGQLVDERGRLREEEALLDAEPDGSAREELKPLLAMSPSEDRVLRERIDAYIDEQGKIAHRVEVAKENYTSSQASYEALRESVEHHAAQTRSRRQRSVQVVLSVLLPFGFACLGMQSFVHGRQISSLSFTALGIGLVAFALLLAGAALVMLFRPDKRAEQQGKRLQDAQWVMLQDKKKLEACSVEREEFDARVAKFLFDAGLAGAAGSPRRARSLLDEAKDARAEVMLRAQRRNACSAHLSTIEGKLADVAKRRDGIRIEAGSIHAEAGADAPLTLAALDAEMERKLQQRETLLNTFAHVNRRCGELEQELTQAKGMRNLDALKLSYQQVRTRQDESAEAYARLLLARRMLEASIAAWESKSQPEVYRKAGDLLGMMTGGRWVKVSMTPEGRLQVSDAVKSVRDPVCLSLGTCQQLYLALRIALLLTADNVGRSIPILADDILVNFDAARRLGAARALVELSKVRQVILFTCHEEVLMAMRQVDPSLNKIAL